MAGADRVRSTPLAKRSEVTYIDFEHVVKHMQLVRRLSYFTIQPRILITYIQSIHAIHEVHYHQG